MTTLSPLRRFEEREEARRYAALILSERPDDPHHWPSINAAIIDHYSETALRRIKVAAWKIIEGTR